MSLPDVNWNNLENGETIKHLWIAHELLIKDGETNRALEMRRAIIYLTRAKQCHS